MYYDEISEGYEELHKEEQLKKIELIKKHLKLKPSDKLLDVGCGTGLTTEPWKCKKIGLDPAINLLRKAGSGIWVNAEAEHIPFKNSVFDAAVSITAIQNFHDIEKGLLEIKRVCKDKVVLSFLKKSGKREMIERLIKKHFKIEKVIEEERDLMFIGKVLCCLKLPKTSFCNI